MKATGNFEACLNVDPMTALTEDTRAHIDHWVAKFPSDRKRSAVIQSLMAAQEQNGGWLTDALIAAVAKYLEIPAIWAYEVASFYSMFDLEPVGRHKVSICTNISCWLNGAEDLVRHAEKTLGCKHGGTSKDGRITLKVEEECVAACAGAVAVVIDGHYHERVTPNTLDALFAGLK